MTAEYKVHGDVAVITLNNPPVNGLGHETRLGITNALAQANADAAVKAVVLTGAGKAFSGGASTCTSVAAQIEGTIPHECSSVAATPRRVRIGHPSGALPIFAHVERDTQGTWVVREVHFSRTVRRLMDGTTYLRRSLLDQ